MSLDLILSYFPTKIEKSYLLITINNSDIEFCYQVSDLLEDKGLIFKAWFKTSTGYELMMLHSHK